MSLEHSPARQGGPRLAFTVDEFCEAHRVGRTWLYAEWRAGRGPKFKMCGAHRIITAEAAAEWRNAGIEAPAA